MNTFTVGISLLAVLAGAKPIQVARDLSVQNVLQVSGDISTSTLQVNGTLTGTSIEVAATLETNTVRSDTMYIDVLSSKSGDTILVEGDLEMVGAAKGETSASTAPVSFLATSVVIDGIKQWSLYDSENFDDQSVGAWTNTDGNRLSTTTCGHPDDYFLGGACTLASGAVVKTFHGLPPHKQIRIKATMHFIDQWEGEQAWCKLNGNYVWLNTIGHPSAPLSSSSSVAASRDTKASPVMSVCGSSDHADLALGTLVDVTKRHDGDSLSIEVGTSLGETDTNSCTQSWGIDDIQIYVR